MAKCSKILEPMSENYPAGSGCVVLAVLISCTNTLTMVG